MPNMFQMAKQALEMRNKMKRIQKQLAAMTFDYENAGVKVKISGELQIVELSLTEEAFADRVRLQRTLPENINKAIRIAKEGTAKEMANLTKDMGGLGDLIGAAAKEKL